MIYVYFSFTGSFGIGVSDATKSSFLTYAELLQSVGVENFQHSWDSALDSYHLAAHCVLPVPTSKESDKVIVIRMTINQIIVLAHSF